MYAGEETPLAAVGGTLAYSKGFLVHEMLAQTIGRERFGQILRKFILDHTFQEVTLEQFRAAVQAGAGIDMQWFFDQWYERKGAPEFNVEWKQDGRQVAGSISQSAPYYRVALEVVAEGRGKRRDGIVEVNGPRTEFSWSVPFNVTAVRLDPDFKVLHSTLERRREAEELVPMVQAEQLWYQRKVAEAEAKLDAGILTLPSPDHGGRFMAQAARVFLASETGKLAEIKIHANAALASETRRMGWLPFVYYWQAVYAKETGDRSLLEQSTKAAVAADRILVAPSGWGQAATYLMK